MPAGAADMLTQYLTFVSKRSDWRLYRGAGTMELVAERAGAEPVIDIAGADQPVLWLVCAGSDRRGAVHRVHLPDLAPERIPWSGRRIGAVASAPNGERAAVLELPDDVDEVPRLHVWTHAEWSFVETSELPDISSRLAWIGSERIAYESAARRLTVIDLGSSNATATGPPGHSPTPAWRRGEWYAVSEDTIVAFPADGAFETPTRPVEGLTYGSPSQIRVTADGEVCTWTEPRFVKQVRGFIQRRGEKRRRFRALEDGVAAVVGPYGGAEA